MMMRRMHNLHSCLKPFNGLTGRYVSVKSTRKSVGLTAGGLDEISYVTRLTPDTSFVIRDEILRRTSGGKTYLKRASALLIVDDIYSLPVRRHEILGLNCAKCNNLDDTQLSVCFFIQLVDGTYLFIGPSVAHNTDGLHGQ